MIEIGGSVFLQVFLGLLFVLVLYFITLVVLSIDSLVTFPSFQVKQREETTIRTGNATSAQLAKTRLNTVFPFKKNYARIARSVNGTTGTQFTYQFWLKVKDGNTRGAFKDLVLLLKGDNKKYKLGYYKRDGTKIAKPESEEPAKYMIKCPLIKFNSNYKTLRVEFNTNNHPDTGIDINLDKSVSLGDDARRTNPLSMLPLDWVMMTFVFEENYSVLEGNENGIRFTFYVNDTPVQTNTAATDPILRSNFLKQNDGDLFLLPNFEGNGDIFEMSDIKYFNYARTDAEIKSDFKKRAKTLADSVHSPNMFTSVR